MNGINHKNVATISGAEGTHISVMPREILEYLRPFPGGCYVDATVGLGGHARRVAEKMAGKGLIIGLDRDSSSLELARRNLAEFGSLFEWVSGNFRDAQQLLAARGIDAVDGVVMDLGISSFQLDDEQRGFSFQTDGPLDMRMSCEESSSAADLVNTLSEEEIANIIYEYGEERFSRRIARRIVEQRRQHPITTTGELRDVVMKSLPRGYQRHKIHPATRTFQALRIAVNHELDSLEHALDAFIFLLKPGARICVIAFHSLEDRIVKEKFRAAARAGVLELIVKKPLRPSEEEASANSRARSARLRVAERKI